MVRSKLLGSTRLRRIDTSVPRGGLWTQLCPLSAFDETLIGLPDLGHGGEDRWLSFLLQLQSDFSEIHLVPAFLDLAVSAKKKGRALEAYLLRRSWKAKTVPRVRHRGGP